MNIFEDMRRANTDFYVAHPLTFLEKEQLAALAEAHGMTVDELKAHLMQPRIESTCPLCGRPSTHLVQCKGCGGGSWGFEMEEAYGHDVIERLRQGLTVTLQTAGQTVAVTWEERQIQHAVQHAYQMSGCMVCPACWEHTLAYDAYQHCPLFLLTERITAHSSIPFQSMLAALISGEQPAVWVKRIFRHWCEIWNTAYATEAEKTAIATWRATLLHGALDQPEAFLTHKADARAVIAELMDFNNPTDHERGELD